MDGERLEGELGSEKLDMEGRVLVPKRVYVSCGDLEIFGLTESFLGCLSMLKELPDRHTRSIVESGLKGS